MSFNVSSSVADADGFTSSGSSFALPSSSHGPNRSSHKLVILNGMDEVEVWSDAVVLLFIQYRLLGDLMGLKTALRCLPLHAKTVAAEEKSYWARFLRLKVLAELRLLGISKPGPYVPLPPLPPFVPMGVFAPPDLSSATNKTQAKALLDAAMELYNKTREDHDTEVAAIIARHVKSCDLHAKEYQAIATNFEQEKESVMSLLSSQFLGDARLSLWIHILPSLGIAHHKIQDTVPFANPAELVYALEQAIYRDRDGEKLQLQLQFWQASLSNEGNGDPVRFHRYVSLAGKKLALLNAEPVRDLDMRAVFIKGLPDDIFLDFKTALHNNADKSKTFNDVFEMLKVYAGSESVKQKIGVLMRSCSRSFDKRPPAGVFVADAREKHCFDFAKGKCARSNCKFAHVSGARSSVVPSPTLAVVCAHCGKKGHTLEVCRSRLAEGKGAPPTRSRPVAKRAIPTDARGRAAFLLDIRQSIDELMQEGGQQQDEQQHGVFTFTAVVPVVPVVPVVRSPVARIASCQSLIATPNGGSPVKGTFKNGFSSTCNGSLE